MELRRWMMTLGAGALLVAGSACQKSGQERAREERKDVAEAQKDVREERQDLTKEQREQQQDAATATRGEREDVAEAQKKVGEESAEARQAAGAAAASSGAVSGKVISSSGDELVVRPAGEDKDVRLKVGSGTEVSVGGQRASVDQLREGTQVRASFDEKDGERQATMIEAEQ